MTSQKIDSAKYVDEQEQKQLLQEKLANVDITTADQNGEEEETNSKKSSDNEEDQFSPANVSFLQKVIRKGLVESKSDIEVQRKDPNSPLYSVKSFEALNLNPKILKGVHEMGFSAPTRIQEFAFATLLVDPPKNLIAESQPGTGKTAAFLMAMLSRVDTTKMHPQVLCLSPTHELAIQTGEVATCMAKFCPEIKMKFAVRGEELPRNYKLTEHIIIGIPGKVLDWGVKFRFFDLKKISVFVLDEADVMIAQQGHQDQFVRIHKLLNPTCQMMFFSATYNQEVMDFAEVIVQNPIVMRLRREEKCPTDIQQYYVKCSNQEDKYQTVTNICRSVSASQAIIIFCHTRKTANWLAEKMFKKSHAVALLNGDLTVEQRINVLNRFKSGQEKVLITTNVLSRGIHFEQVKIVVNFDLPVDLNNGRADCETYLYRIGRTGRFGKKGIAISLVDSPQTMKICKDIEEYFDTKIKLLNAEVLD